MRADFPAGAQEAAFWTSGGGNGRGAACRAALGFTRLCGLEIGRAGRTRRSLLGASVAASWQIRIFPTGVSISSGWDT